MLKSEAMTGFKTLGGGRNALLARLSDVLGLFPRPLRERGKNAFTLAEVLITLAIIGVVAAMTIPTLVANYQEKSWGTAATVFERKLTEAMRVMNANATLAGHTTTESFVEELSKHFKTTKICNNTELMDCFVDSVTMRNNPVTIDLTGVSTSADFGQNNWNTNLVGAQFANGTTALIAYNPKCQQDPYSNQITGNNCLAILYDTSGHKQPNHLSHDLRANGYVKKIGTKLVCSFEIDNTCYGAPFKPATMSYTKCAGENATSVNRYTPAGSEASSLGIVECRYDDDYWAGAVEACGGTNKMPDEGKLIALAKYLYNEDSIGRYGESGISIVPEKIVSLGLPTPEFALWSSEEDNGNGAYARIFRSDFTIHNYYGRTNDRPLAVCIE